MDTYLFILYLITILGSLILLGGFLFYFGIRPQTRNLVAQSKALQLKINQFKNELPDFKENSTSIVGDALGNIGIEGILNELGIDSKIVNNPLVKGLIEKYAPRVLEQLSKKKDEGPPGFL